jgi:hypothetical protein
MQRLNMYGVTLQLGWWGFHLVLSCVMLEETLLLFLFWTVILALCMMRLACCSSEASWLRAVGCSISLGRHRSDIVRSCVCWPTTTPLCSRRRYLGNFSHAPEMCLPLKSCFSLPDSLVVATYHLSDMNSEFFVVQVGRTPTLPIARCRHGMRAIVRIRCERRTMWHLRQ